MSTEKFYAPGVEGLVQAELGLPEPPPAGKADWLVHPPGDLYGLALSGGGIRSATYNLGLVQGLKRLGLLGSFDYVATVSGGGYLGGFWSAWRKRRGGDVFPDAADPCSGREADEIRHLREFSNFLSPRMGVFSYDTGRMLVAALGGMLPSLLASLSLLVLVFAAMGGFASLLFLQQGDAALRLRAPGGAWAVASLTAVVMLAFEVAWARRGERAMGPAYWAAASLAVLLSGAGWTVAARVAERSVAGPPVDGSLPLLAYSALLTDWLVLLAPAAVWGGVLAAFLLLRFLFSRAARYEWGKALRCGLDRASSRLLFLAAGWTVLSVLWCAGVVLARLAAREGAGAETAVAGSGGIVLAVWVQTRLQKLASQDRRGAGAPKLSARIKAILPRVVAYPVLAAIAVGVVALLTAAHGVQEPVFRDLSAYGAAVAAAAVVTLLTVLFYQPEQVGLHAFYRSRLARAYLGASRPRTRTDVGRVTEDDAADDLALCDLPADRPVHLVCCAANDLAPTDPLAGLNRGACSAVLSRAGFSVGTTWAGWPEERARVPTLGSAITASGAAFNSNMGAKSVYFGPAATFLMAAFGLRLGLWLTHPAQGREPEPRKDARGWRPHRVWSRRTGPVGLPFYKELLGVASAGDADVHLSDGAHFENTAVYELIRRHCRVIVASDCGQDGERAFDDLGNLVRRVRIDFGVDVRIDLAPLKPGPDGTARQHMVAGDIHYPDGDTGVLLIFKPTLTGGEPADVAQYRARNDAFPHETTVDQFYDEAQWEAYRRLGEFAALTALRRVAEGLPRGRTAPGQDECRAWTGAVFSGARREWLAVPDGAVERLPRFTAGVAALDETLRQPGCATLLREVYPELAGLERSAGVRQVWVGTLVGGQPRAEGEGSASAAASVPAPDDPVATLHAVRAGLNFLYELYRCEDLERNFSHPVYLGVMNYAARWTSAPLVALWWPLLKTGFPLPFARFLEGRLGLGARLRNRARVGPAGEGYAAGEWKREGRAPLQDEGVTALAYEMDLRYGDAVALTSQLAVVRARAFGDVLAWDADDLYVPPGLWGVGIGGDLVRHLAGGAAGDAYTALLVRVPVNPKAGNAAKKQVADAMQLYRSFGFRDAGEADRTLRCGDWEWPLPAGLEGGAGAQWMVLPVAPAAGPPAPAAGRGAGMAAAATGRR
ncbi:MAG: hypothetical protein AB1941_26380 [Gemmatimonadota bacterium]